MQEVWSDAKPAAHLSLSHVLRSVNQPRRSTCFGRSGHTVNFFAENRRTRFRLGGFSVITSYKLAAGGRQPGQQMTEMEAEHVTTEQVCFALHAMRLPGLEEPQRQGRKRAGFLRCPVSSQAVSGRAEGGEKGQAARGFDWRVKRSASRAAAIGRPSRLRRRSFFCFRVTRLLSFSEFASQGTAAERSPIGGFVMSAFQVSDVVKLQVAKAIGSLDLVARKMNRRLFASRAQRDNVVHDLEVLRMVGNLQSMTAEYLAGNDSVVLAQTIEFSPNGNGRNGKFVDSARGVELPVFPPGLIVNHEFSVSWNDRCQQELLQHLLKINWSDKSERTRAKGTEIPLKHHEKITGGQNGGTIFVSDLARHFGRVTYVAEGRGFAFAMDETLGQSVWLHVSHASKGFTFKKGARVSFVVVDVPAGLQGRDIRRA